jgi:hypothetical protein
MIIKVSSIVYLFKYEMGVFVCDLLMVSLGKLPAVRQVDDWRRSLGALLRMSSQRLAVDEASWAGCTAGTPATNLQSGSFTSSIIIPAMGPPN